MSISVKENAQQIREVLYRLEAAIGDGRDAHFSADEVATAMEALDRLAIRPRPHSRADIRERLEQALVFHNESVLAAVEDFTNVDPDIPRAAALTRVMGTESLGRTLALVGLAVLTDG